MTISAGHILTKYRFKQLIPGLNDDSFKFEGGGIVVIAKALPETDPGVRAFDIVNVYDARDDALSVAKSLLTQPHEQHHHRFALIGSIPNLNKFEALDVLRDACKGDNE